MFFLAVAGHSRAYSIRLELVLCEQLSRQIGGQRGAKLQLLLLKGDAEFAWMALSRVEGYGAQV